MGLGQSKSFSSTPNRRLKKTVGVEAIGVQYVEQLRETVYRFNPEELPKIGAVTSLMKEVVHVPRDFSQQEFEIGLDKPELRNQRSALEVAPDEEKILLREFLESRRKANNKEPLVGGTSPYRVRRGMVVFRSRAPELSTMAEFVNDVFGDECPVQGNFYYPPKGFRGWHTNAYDRPGWRMYVVLRSNPGSSCFRTFDDKQSKIIDFADEKENIYFFRIHPKFLLCHGVLSIDSHRWSIGFAVPRYWRSKSGLENLSDD